jgi:hypothetical protein
MFLEFWEEKLNQNLYLVFFIIYFLSYIYIELFMDEFRLEIFINMKEIIHGEIIRYINLDRTGKLIEIQVIKNAVDVCFFFLFFYFLFIFLIISF